MRTQPVSLSDIGARYWQGCAYGPPGAGKTILATTSVLNTFVYDVDQGLNATLAWRRKYGMRLDNIFVWPIQTTADFDAATTWLLNNMRSFQGGLVVIDSATELQRLIIAETCAKSKRIAPSQPEWGAIRTVSENLTVKFRYMPVHLVYTCHEIYKYDPDYERDVWRPSFDGRFAFEYAKHFSWIARLVAKHTPTGRTDASGKAETQIIRALNFGPDPFAHAKDRSATMAQWELPHLDTILARMIASTTDAPAS